MKKVALCITVALFIILIGIIFYLFVFMKDIDIKVADKYVYDVDELLFALITPYKKDYNIEIRIDNNGTYSIKAISKNKTIVTKTEKLTSKDINNLKDEIKRMHYRNLKSFEKSNLEEDIYNINVHFIDKTISIENISMNDDTFKNLLLMIYNKNGNIVKLFNQEIDKYYSTLNKNKNSKKEVAKENVKQSETKDINNKSKNISSTTKKTNPKKDTSTNSNKSETQSCKGKPMYNWMKVDYKTFDECMNVANSYNDGIPRFCSEVVDCTGTVLGFMLDY